MTNLQDLSRKVYEAMAEWTDAPLPTFPPLRIGDAIKWLKKSGFFTGEYNHTGIDYTVGDIVLILSDKRPKDHLSQPIPLDPDEERRPLLEFLLGLI